MLESGRRVRARWRRLENDASVGAARAERVDANPQWTFLERDFHEWSRKFERGEINRGVGRLEMEVARNPAVMGDERPLDEARNAGRPLEVTEVGLDPANP